MEESLQKSQCLILQLFFQVLFRKLSRIAKVMRGIIGAMPICGIVGSGVHSSATFITCDRVCYSFDILLLINKHEFYFRRSRSSTVDDIRVMKTFLLERT